MASFGGRDPPAALQAESVALCTKQLHLTTAQSVPGIGIYDKRISSPFWQLARLLSVDCTVVWNNPDKLHTYAEGKSRPLTAPMEKALGCPFVHNGETVVLLRREIEIIRPDVVLFVTGPRYRRGMADALGIPDRVLTQALLRTTTPLSPITTHALKVNIPLLWTYHPAYLSRLGLLDGAAGAVRALL